MEQYLRVGVIASTHGVHGEVKVYPTTDSLERFRDLKEVVAVTARNEKKLLLVEGVKFFKQFAILKFREVATMDEAQKYKGCDLMVSRENAQPLAENEYYIGDLLGLTVETEEGESLGILADVLQTGANDVYVVKRPDGRELLLPVINSCILDVDLEKGLVKAHLMEGLLDL
ncbi:MAG: ribosome maturation factor RimM [Lachnospiraceae bacterium]|jgi:16S rRNA processing protein RimM|nr:ribosome maturation factor RimM [Lachnospiraceae bacterium]